MARAFVRALAILTSIIAPVLHPLNAAIVSEGTILALDRAVDSAILAQDTDFLQRTLDSTFRFTHGDGQTQSKEELISAVRSGRMRAKVREVSEQKVELHGAIAIVTGRIHVVRNNPDPARRDYTIWYLRVYETRAHDVVLVSHQTMRTTLVP